MMMLTLNADTISSTSDVQRYIQDPVQPEEYEATGISPSCPLPAPFDLPTLCHRLFHAAHAESPRRSVRAVPLMPPSLFAAQMPPAPRFIMSVDVMQTRSAKTARYAVIRCYFFFLPRHARLRFSPPRLLARCSVCRHARHAAMPSRRARRHHWFSTPAFSYC